MKSAVSPIINIVMGMMTNDASRFAALTDVDCTEITIAALTINNAWAIVSRNNCTKTSGSGMSSP
jgi:hypothetical protein